MIDMHRRIRGLLCALLALALAAQPCIAWSDAAVARGAPQQLRSTLPGELSARHLTVLGLRVGNDGLAAVQGRVGEAVAFSPDDVNRSPPTLAPTPAASFSATPARHRHCLSWISASLFRLTASSSFRAVRVRA